MVFYCQRNCYEKEYTSKVVSCKPAQIDVVENGEKLPISCYQATFEDTIFFPEGGGQPDDRGTVNGIKVFRVLRYSGEAIHYIEDSLGEGSEVRQIIDWDRRHDHMQQHSAQHLITENIYGYKTLSWYLGECFSFIELDVSEVSQDVLEDIEHNVNLKIRQAIPVKITEYSLNDAKLLQIRTRGLPEDVRGPVRVVEIEGIDSNMCCGTHVSNLSDIQSIKLLYIEKGKNNHTLLYFISGQRILRYLSDCVSREKKLNIVLHTSPADHIRLVQKCQLDLKVCQKSLKEALKDLAIAQAHIFSAVVPKPSYFICHRHDGDKEYCSTLINAINDSKVLKVLTYGEDKGQGSLVIHGPLDIVSLLAPKLCEIFEGKGGGGRTQFTAKVSRLGKRKEAEAYIKSYFENNQESN